MKFCDTHWNQVQEAIKTRGLDGLIYPESRNQNFVGLASLEGKETDPLLMAHMSISGYALECGGLYLLYGDYCPLCEADKYTGGNIVSNWINGCADDIKQEYGENPTMKQVVQ